MNKPATWTGPWPEPGTLVLLPNGHEGVVQPYDPHPARSWVSVKDMRTAVHHVEFVADLKPVTS